MMRFKRLPSVPLSVLWANDGTRLVAGCADGRVRVIDPDSLDIFQDQPVLKGWVHSLATAGELIFAAGEGGHQMMKLTRSRSSDK
jgi:hypothetical protein